MKIDNFWGELTDISAIEEPLLNTIDSMLDRQVLTQDKSIIHPTPDCKNMSWSYALSRVGFYCRSVNESGTNPSTLPTSSNLTYTSASFFKIK